MTASILKYIEGEDSPFKTDTSNSSGVELQDCKPHNEETLEINSDQATESGTLQRNKRPQRVLIILLVVTATILLAGSIVVASLIQAQDRERDALVTEYSAVELEIENLTDDISAWFDDYLIWSRFKSDEYYSAHHNDSDFDSRRNAAGAALASRTKEMISAYSLPSVDDLERGTENSDEFLEAFLNHAQELVEKDKARLQELRAELGYTP